MSNKELVTFICGKRAGLLSQSESGLLSFVYDTGYEGAPLSLTMPVTNRTYRHKIVRPYLFGLLPDSEQQRRAIAREYDVSPNNPLALLAHIGLDCPGAVQFCEATRLDEIYSRVELYRPLSDNDIAARLASIRQDDDATWMGRDESWSLGGNQGKFALARHEGAWCECLGSAPTTHIFKYGVEGFRLEALNEFICMRTASLCDVPAADVAYRLFNDEPALIVRRYDRIAQPGGTTMRLHQEDLCQALGVMPDQKYTSDGGPATADVIKLLATTKQASTNLYLFTRMLFFNCLIGAPDAHAKNYSLLLGSAGDTLLAPLYDAASGLAYERMRKKGKMAMAIGGENRFGRVGSGALQRYAGATDSTVAKAMEQAGLDANRCTRIMSELALKVPNALARAFDESCKIPGLEELRERMERPIAQNCKRTLALL